MRILIVEDDGKKLDQICEAIAGARADATLDAHRSYRNGLAAILEHPPDVVVLDMTMPTYDLSLRELGGRTRPYAGREIMEEMLREGIERPVIIVTGFDVFGEGDTKMTLEELRAELREEYPGMFVGAVHYDASSVRWVEELTRFLGRAEQLISRRRARGHDTDR